MLRKRCSLAWLGIMALRWLLDEETLMPAASVSMRVLLESFHQGVQIIVAECFCTSWTALGVWKEITDPSET